MEQMEQAEWHVRLSPEVRAWHDSLKGPDAAITHTVIKRLRESGSQLRMPHSRPLGRGLFELRFTLADGRVEQRIT